VYFFIFILLINRKLLPLQQNYHIIAFMTTPELQNTEQQALALFQKIDTLIQHAKKHLKTAVDLAMVYTYFEIGREIVEDEQKGQLRAEYGTYLLENVAQKLTAKYKRGYSADNLKLMRRFYVVYAQDTIRETLFPQLENYPRTSNGLRFFLSWSHYIKLMRIDNIEERHFYEIESMQNHWALSELKRQFDSSLYERLALSSNKEKVKQLALVGQQIETAADLVKDPLVIEFLGLDEQTNYLESDLEKRIIDNLQKFMLELGKGFTFVGRQVRFTFQEAHFRCDLVFYNRLLRCFVLFDLKIGEIKHQDIGQMQMYVNFYDRQVKLPDENKTIGIILCKDKNDAVVEMTLPENNDQIFASKYQTVLPSKEELKKLMANNSQ
jgi:predicted nuclease of restriction endonuclease-like (RecB) superfamily